MTSPGKPERRSAPHEAPAPPIKEPTPAREPAVVPAPPVKVPAHAGQNGIAVEL